jgi:hypothetical protein
MAPHVEQQLSLFHGTGTPADEWKALFQRADCTVKKLRLSGWVCPACGAVEPNRFILWQNHGLDPDEPQDGPPTCPNAPVGGAGR